MSLLRRTSTYRVEVSAANPIAALENMLLRCPREVAASGVNRDKAHVRFRCESNDNVALNIALEIAGGRQFVLTTGYGVNQREVVQ